MFYFPEHYYSSRINVSSSFNRFEINTVTAALWQFYNTGTALWAYGI